MAGQLYDCGDTELLTQRHKAKDLARDYNQTNSADAEEKERILRELLGGTGKNLWITAPFYVDYGNNIYFGNNCEVNMNYTFLDDNIIRIGDNALIAPNVQIYTAFHPTNAIDRFGVPKEDGSFEWVSATLGLGVWNYGAIVTAIIYAKYSSDQIEAINSNMMQLMLDATSVPEDKAKEYRNEALELQAWRNHAKELAKEYLECKR